MGGAGVGVSVGVAVGGAGVNVGVEVGVRVGVAVGVGVPVPVEVAVAVGVGVGGQFSIETSSTRNTLGTLLAAVVLSNLRTCAAPLANLLGMTTETSAYDSYGAPSFSTILKNFSSSMDTLRSSVPFALSVGISRKNLSVAVPGTITTVCDRRPTSLRVSPPSGS